MKSGVLDNMAPNAQRAFITTLVLVVVAVVLYMFAVVPEEDALKKARAAFTDEEGNKARIDSILKNATTEKASLDNALRRLKGYRAALLERRLGSYATHAREILDPLALGAGLVEIDYPESSIRKLPLPERATPNLPAQLHARVAVRMTAHGSYQSAVSFLLRVEKELPLVALQSLRVATDRSDPRRQAITFVFEWPTLGDALPSPPGQKARR